MSVPTRAELRDQLLATRIVGSVATGRDSVTANAQRLAAGEAGWTFGLELSPSWTYEGVIELMAQRVGIDPDSQRHVGDDTIDADLCLDALDRMATVVAEVAAGRGRVLLATGHPTGLLPVQQALARGLASAGCELLTPADGDPLVLADRPLRLLAVGGVLMLATQGQLLHTHSPEPMRLVLDSTDVTPDLVIADHGWAGAAGQAGVRTVGFADCNDPALFVGESEGRIEVAVPLDDNVRPAHYGPLTAYLLGAAGLG